MPVDVWIWDRICGKRQVSNSGVAIGPKIYDRTVVWSDARENGSDIYMAEIHGCCGDSEHPSPVGDLNKDCRVDLVDLAILASHWLECTAPQCE